MIVSVPKVTQESGFLSGTADMSSLHRQQLTRFGALCETPRHEVVTITYLH
jgi:hypothetical protein